MSSFVFNYGGHFSTSHIKSNSVCHLSLLKIYLNFSVRIGLRTEHLKFISVEEGLGGGRIPTSVHQVTAFCRGNFLPDRDKQSVEKLR